jgi:hypothetical protein
MCSKGNATKTPGTNDNLGKGTPLPIILTLVAKIISLQRKVETVVSREFFWNTAAGTQVTKSMVDYNATKQFLTAENPHYFTFSTKRDIPVKSSIIKMLKAVIRYLPGNISTENITVAFQVIDYDAVSVKQKTVKHSTTEGVTDLFFPSS